jgi:hypothetical protein
MYNDLITDKRMEITYNLGSRWFWKFCRSKLPSRDDPNNTHRHRNNRKTQRGGRGDENINKPTEHTVIGDDTTNPPVLHRAVAEGRTELNPLQHRHMSEGYIETSKRKVSNKPAWIMSECGGHSNCRANSDNDETTSLMSDDGEFDAFEARNSV